MSSSAVRNPDGIWINTKPFKEEGVSFIKNGYYCSDLKGTASYKEYWDEELRRCKEGYSVGGAKITEHHYFYLNYAPIQVAKETGGKTAKKTLDMPDFWDGDYAFFWAIEIAKNGLFNKDSLVPSTIEERTEYNLPTTPDWRKMEMENIVIKRLHLPYHIENAWLDGGHHVIVGKSRRKGYSFKNAAICANTYNTVRRSLSIIGAFDKKYLYPTGTMGMATSYLNFLNKYTAWGKGREFVNKQEHKRASFEEMIEGVKTESGYMSEIMALTFGDNPDAARGKDAVRVLFEEAGAFPNLKESFNATAPGLTAGKYLTGQIVIFGTGGDMESGTADFADMFYNPKQHNLMPFVNIWDDNAENSSCGFFHPVNWNMEGYYDVEGNSDFEGARKAELKVRDSIIKNSTSSQAIQQRVQEWPLNPAEAFLTISMNDFPIIELRARYNKVVRENLHLKLGQPCYLSRDENGKAKITPDLTGTLSPLWDYKPKTKDLRGSLVVYEPPIVNPPKGLYKIGFDPYRQQNSSSTLPSLAAIYVYKSNHKFSYSRDTIVAQYVGRPYSPDEVNRIAEMLAELYNAEIMHENEVTHVKGYFEKRKKLELLASQPDNVISVSIKKSKVDRVYGIHMNEKLKDAGEKYIKTWLLEERDVNGEGEMILNLETISDPALLEELILYNRKGNFDRVMAFMMVMFQIEADGENKQYGDNQPSKNVENLVSLLDKQFKKV